ncbi:MAG: hypothetical protein KBF45_07265 [Cyclobacteriaceae bacterium]|jgi:uncharacterized membrane protein YagU involved in acid resistance|nr:hypothetical protein [Cyclobacteriaceae bacterium]
MQPYKPTLRIILLAGLAAGVLDITAAILIYCVKGSLPIITLFQSIARGVLGDPAFQGGWSTAMLGLLLHFLIATLFAAGYSLMLKVIPALYKSTLAVGLGYGIVAWLTMNYLVVPLSFAARGAIVWNSNTFLNIGAHLFCVGLSIVYVTHRAYKTQLT